jgi:hypothetical protein
MTPMRPAAIAQGNVETHATQPLPWSEWGIVTLNLSEYLESKITPFRQILRFFSPMKILLLEDDRSTSDFLAETLTAQRYAIDAIAWCAWSVIFSALSASSRAKYSSNQKPAR